MGVGAGLYMYVEKFTFTISSSDEFLLLHYIMAVVCVERYLQNNILCRRDIKQRSPNPTVCPFSTLNR